MYLNTYETVQEARDAIGQYIEWYNHERRHSGIDNHRPIEVMLGLKHPSYWPFKQTTEIKQKQVRECPKICGNSKKGIKFYPQI